MKNFFPKGRLLVVPLLSFCLITAFIFSGYEEMNKVDCFSPYLKFEGQDQDLPTFVEKMKLIPSFPDSDHHTPTGGFPEYLPGFFSLLSRPDHSPNSLRC
jgi:hypothetical protein